MKRSVLARTGLSLDRLGGFLQVVEAGGIAAAAAGDPVRQSQLSRQLKELEEYFGSALIERGRGAFRLTAAGRELSDIARTTLTRLDDLGQSCAGGRLELHLGAGESVFVWLVLPRLGALLAREPRIALTLHNLQSEEILRQLRDGRLDFGILRRTPPAAGLQSAALPPMGYALFVPRETLPNPPEIEPKTILATVPLALLEGSSELNRAIEDWAAAEGVSLQTRVRCTSYQQAAEAVRHLRMAAVLPVWAEPALGRVAVVQVDLPAIRSLRTPLHLVWSKRQCAMRAFLPRLAKVLAVSLTRDARPVAHGCA